MIGYGYVWWKVSNASPYPPMILKIVLLANLKLMLGTDFLVEHSQGWKLPDFMFATRRSLSDAYDNVGNQIDGFYSSLSASSYFPLFIYRSQRLFACDFC